MTEKSCDILVIGAGGSGMTAACRAAEAGKKVLVIEKAGYIGGGTIFASAMRLFNSKWLTERGAPDNTATYLRKRMDQALWRFDRKLVETVVKGTGEFFDWFWEIAPQEVRDTFTVEKAVTDDPNDTTYAPVLKEFTWGGLGKTFVNVCKNKFRELGGEVLLKVTTEKILVEDGKAVGVIAHQNGETLHIQAKAVIIACGSWSRNTDFAKEYYPEFYEAVKNMSPSAHLNPNYTGDGYHLAKEAGALMDTKNLTVRMMGPVTMYKGMGIFASSAPNALSSTVFGNIANGAFSIYVNKNGKRFVCEASQARMGVNNSGIVQMEQPGGLLYAVFDENTLEETVRQQDQKPDSEFDMPWDELKFPETMEEAHADIALGLKDNPDRCFSADTVRELAEKMGVDPDGLENQIQDYNRACAEGMDWDCYKPKEWLVPLNKAPYYAVKTELMTDGAFGGVMVDTRMRVRADKGGVIDGLYAVGDVASGRFINMASRKIEVISDLPYALSSGFLSANDAVKYVDA